MRSFRYDVSAIPLVILTIALSGCSGDAPKVPEKPGVTAVPAIALRRAVESGSKTAPAEVEEESPPAGVRVAASSETDSGEVPLSVHLESEVREGSGKPPYSYLWDFGDGSAFGTTSAVTHVYTFPGKFRAHIIVKDSAGSVSMDYIDVDVESPEDETHAVPPMTAAEAMEILRKGAEARKSGEANKAP